MTVDCEAHKYVMEMIKDLKDLVSEVSRGQQDNREIIARLSENILELQRFNESVTRTLEELKNYNKQQDKEIQKSHDFTVKAGAIVGLLAFISPFAVWVLGKVFV